MLEKTVPIAMEILRFIIAILLIAGILGGLAFWGEKLRGRRELLAYMEKEKLKADLKE